LGKRRKKNDDFKLIERRDKKLYGQFPLPIMEVDRSGRIKCKTLEILLFKKYESGYDWFSAKELLSDSVFQLYPYLSGWRCLSMRLLRYTRQGLLERIKIGRCFKYRLTRRGEDRLEYLWNKFGMLSPVTEQRIPEEVRHIKNTLSKSRLYLGIRMNQDRIKIVEERERQLARMDFRPFYKILPPPLPTSLGWPSSLLPETKRQPVRQIYDVQTKRFRSAKYR
jgi:hypothetical protein